jgi:octaprenyl-diphosphate synthase
MSTATVEKPRSLTDIKRPIEENLVEFQKYFRESMRSRVRLLDIVTQYTLRRKGKQVRPILVLLSAGTCGKINDTTYVGAALVELLHTATLVHDDVVDNAERRRGILAVNAIWKNRIAVLFGDFLLSRGLLLALEHNAYDVLHVVSDAVRRMSEGELLQMDKARRLDIDEDTYYRIISDKTASLFAACAACGAISSSSDPDMVSSMKELGEKIGQAFQIRDDLFDFGGEDVGKPIGNDLQERKITLPLIYALREAEKSDERAILKIIKKRRKSRADIQTVSRFVEKMGGLTYAQNAMSKLADEAEVIARTFPAGEEREALIELIQFVVARRK